MLRRSLVQRIRNKTWSGGPRTVCSTDAWVFSPLSKTRRLRRIGRTKQTPTGSTAAKEGYSSQCHHYKMHRSRVSRKGLLIKIGKFLTFFVLSRSTFFLSRPESKAGFQFKTKRWLSTASIRTKAALLSCRSRRSLGTSRSLWKSSGHSYPR